MIPTVAADAVSLVDRLGQYATAMPTAEASATDSTEIWSESLAPNMSRLTTSRPN